MIGKAAPGHATTSGGSDTHFHRRLMIIALTAWIAGIAISFYNGNTKLPLISLVLGIALLIAMFTGHGGAFVTVGFVVMAMILIIANKLGMT